MQNKEKLVQIQNEKTAWIILAVMIICYFLPCKVGFNHNSVWYSRFVYQFFHVTIWHLLINLTALWEFRKVKFRYFFVAYLISCPILLYGDKLTMGFSGVLFAIGGMCVGTQNSRLHDNIYFLITFVISYFIYKWVGMSNIFIHIYCFYLGQIYGIWMKRWY
jgi:membrane associated rhomboid family serine protease